MKINQPIINNNMNETISYIEDIIKSKFDKNILIFFPKNKNWFQNNFNLLKEICQKNKNIEKTLIYYKRNGYILINSILYHNSFPLVYLFSSYKNKNLFNSTLINSDPIYLFPKDMSNIKNYEKKKYLNHINNIDSIFNNNDFLLDDCILFRGYSMPNKNNNEQKLPNGHDYMNQQYDNFIFNKNANEITLKMYNSFSFNPLVALNFIYNNGYMLILKVNKKDKIPGFFLPNIFFGNNVDYNAFLKKSRDEAEILLPHNIKIKIIKKKEIKVSKKFLDKSINNIYVDKNSNININKKIKIIYAETLPYTYQPFIPDNDEFRYICV
jgi:hypothetical protein